MYIKKSTKGNVVVWNLKSKHFEAQISQQGGQLIYYKRTNEPDIVWRNPFSEFTSGEPIRGGIPICFPWFGNFEQNPEAIKNMASPSASHSFPFHGLVRQQKWRLHSLVLENHICRISFELELDNDYFINWPHTCKIKIDYIFGDNLEVKLTVYNENNYPLPVTLALHTYYHVSDVEHVELYGFKSNCYYDALDSWSKKIQTHEPGIVQEIARTFIERTGTISIIDRGYNRKIIIDSQDSSSCILWNPYKNRSPKLDQFSSEAWKEMLCIETARARDDYLTVPQNESRSINLYISSESL